MVDVADPGTAHAVWCERNVILDPDSLIFEREYAAQAARKVPGEGIDPATLLYILYDDRQIGTRPQVRSQTSVDGDKPVKELIVIANVS